METSWGHLGPSERLSLAWCPPRQGTHLASSLGVFVSSASDPAVASQDTETSCSATKDRVFYPKTACSPSMQPVDREVITGIRGSALHPCKNSHDEMPTLLPPKIPVISFTYLNLLPHLNIYYSLNILPRFVPSVWNASPLYLLFPTPYVQPMPILQGPYQKLFCEAFFNFCSQN